MRTLSVFYYDSHTKLAAKEIAKFMDDVKIVCQHMKAVECINWHCWFKYECKIKKMIYKIPFGNCSIFVDKLSIDVIFM